jgi:elongation factor G
MKDVAVGDVRTFVLVGHSASGKTTLVDALLLKMGVSDRMGLVDNGSSMADYSDEEKNRKSTIYAKPFSGVYRAGGRKLGMVFMDTPGYGDFMGQVIQAARVARAALVVVDANAGIQVGTTRAWKMAATLGLPVGIVVQGLDKENASFDKVVADLQAAWGARCLPAVIPGGAGVLDVMASNDPAAQAARNGLMEAAAETDDALIEKYLGGEALTADELAKGTKAAVQQRKLFPIFACYPLKGTGVAELIEALGRLFPSAVESPILDAAGKPVDPSPTAPFTGFVWRTVNDSFVGQLTFVYVCGGTLTPGMEVQNVTKSQKERVASFSEANGKKLTALDQATAGDIVAVTKLKATGLGDALCAPGHQAAFPPYVFPNPVMWCAVTGKTQGDEDKIGTALQRVAEEDPTIHLERNVDTHEQVLAGMGDVHLAVAVERMKSRSNVDVNLATPKVPYKETVTARGDGHYKHKKQTGGRGQYGEVYLRVEPLPAGDEEWFADAIVGGVIPGNFIPAVQKGVVDGMTRGCVAGYPVIKVKSSVYDGSYHDVDSSEIAFKIAGSRAFKDAMSKARPVLLEPIMQVKIMIPEQFMGDVNGDLSHRRGRILGMEVADGLQLITAEVPQAEMFRYCAELRSMTGGRGSFEMAFDRYEVVPSNVAQKVIAEAEKNKKEEEE